MSDVVNQNSILNYVQDCFEYNSCHGLSENDIIEIRDIITSVQQNDKANQTKFPDFICDKGFIEHFHVTSGTSNRKGHDITMRENLMLKNHNACLNANVSNVDFTKHTSTLLRCDDSLDNFHKSFKKHWIDHINHLHKYNGLSHIACFLISSDDLIFSHENIEDKYGLIYGNLLERQTSNDFYLAYDTELLNYMLGYQNDVDYVIYYNMIRKYVEVIKICNIPQLKEFLSNRKYEFCTSAIIETISSYKAPILEKRTDEKS